MTAEKIAGIKVDFDINYDDVTRKIDDFVAEDSPHYIWTVNPEFIMDAQNDLAFAGLLNESAISTPDGVGTFLARRYLNEVESISKGLLFPFIAFLKGSLLGLRVILGLEKLPESVTGVGLIEKICENASNKGQTVLFLGGWETDAFGKKKPHHGDIARKAADALSERYPGLRVVGATSAFKRTEEDDEKTLAYIHEQMRKSDVSNIDIVFVAYNHKHQESWIKRNLHKVPARVGLGLGGTFDYVAQFQQRSPQSFVRRNLDWLYRLITQPWRLRRTLKAFPVFPLFIYLSSLKTPVNN